MIAARLAALLLLLAALPASAGEFRPYPGARADPDATKAAIETSRQFGIPQDGRSVTVWLTDDSFEKVADFYRKLGREYRPKVPGEPETAGYERDLPAEVKQTPKGIEKVPSGIKAKQTTFILDDAPDTRTSKHWLTIGRPFIGKVEANGLKFTYSGIIQRTAIMEVARK